MHADKEILLCGVEGNIVHVDKEILYCGVVENIVHADKEILLCGVEGWSPWRHAPGD